MRILFAPKARRENILGEDFFYRLTSSVSPHFIYRLPAFRLFVANLTDVFFSIEVDPTRFFRTNASAGMDAAALIGYLFRSGPAAYHVGLQNAAFIGIEETGESVRRQKRMDM